MLDFGIVYLLDRPTSGDRYFGTPLYTSPEQVQQGVKVDHRADIYGLGAVLFHMLCGRPPFESEDVMEILSAHMSAAVPRLRAILVEQPGVEILEALIDKMLAKNRDERFQTLREVIERIDEVLPIVSYTPGASPLRPTTAITLPPAASRTLDLPSAEALATIADRTLWPDRFPALLHAEPGTLPPLLDGTDRALLAVQRDTTATLLRIGFKKQAVEPVLELPDEQLSAFGLSPCTRFLVIADVGAQRVRVLGTRSHQELSSWNLPEREITCLAVSDEGRLIAAGTSSGSLYVIDNWGVEAPLLISKGKPLRAMAFTPDENELAIAREGSHFELLAISEEGANGALLNLESDVAAIAFDPDGLLGAVVTAHFNIHAFSYNEQLLECGSAQVANVVALAFGDDHALTGLSARDGRYRLLDLKGIVKDPTRSVAQGA